MPLKFRKSITTDRTDYVVNAHASCSLIARTLFKGPGYEADAGCSPQAKARNQSYPLRYLHEGVQMSLGKKCLDDISTLLPYEVVAKSAERKISYL